MKTLFIAALMTVAAPLANASSFFINCTNADGSINNLSGHGFETTVNYTDWKTGEKFSVGVPEAQLEILNEISEVERKSNQGVCRPGDSAVWGSSERTYVVKALLQLPDSTPKKIKEVVGNKPQIFLCEEQISWQMPCGE